MYSLKTFVASFTDAWIETDGWVYDEKWDKSHLLQMRGLKPMYRDTRQYELEVASFTDAWIETHSKSKRRLLRIVASFTDAWIETE